MAEAGELSFVKAFVNTISAQPITYDDDYQQPPENSLKKVPVLPIEIPAPERKSEASTSTASITITFKSLKPPQAFTLTVSPTDPISSIKSLLAAEPKAPAADAQRLLLKGKALADSKLLKEYSVKDGDTINLMIKPGYEWDPSKSVPAPSPPVTTPASLSPGDNSGTTDAAAPRRRHQRIPSITLSPSPSLTNLSSSLEKPVDIVLTLDDTSIPSTSAAAESLSAYHTVVAEPAFWGRLHKFLKVEFVDESDALTAFEDFLRATKGTLTASEIAKIRDEVGVVGMAGL